ncbi:hypothetical protein ACQQ9V_10395 [Hornefia butyriciproducens]|uniref:hypothetical protein n=1 Tax=Hornefia butyriciproducens TaxID=2652293 RepID=UPI003CFD8F6F
MSFDVKKFQKELAQQKVYDTWQYVNSLREMLTYMNMSCELLDKVYAQRAVKLKEKEQEIMRKVVETGKASVYESDLHCTDLEIAGLTIDDGLFLQKTTMEFFHYARMCSDILFQIINAALLGDSSFQVDDRGIIKNVNDSIDGNPNFSTLKSLLDANKNDDTFKYIQAFDNYIKHIKTVLVTVKSSFMLGNNNEFIIQEFINSGITYPAQDAITIVEKANKYINETVEAILTEVQNQLPNCVDNSQRIHNISFKFVAKQLEKGIQGDYMSFFIDVENDISELPTEIKVLPLIIKPNDDIYSFDFKFKKIFIRKKGTDEDGIIGCAEIKNGFDTNEFYRIFTVRACNITEYYSYISTFTQEYPKISVNFAAMEGSTIIYQD